MRGDFSLIDVRNEGWTDSRAFLQAVLVGGRTLAAKIQAFASPRSIATVAILALIVLLGAPKVLRVASGAITDPPPYRVDATTVNQSACGAGG